RPVAVMRLEQAVQIAGCAPCQEVPLVVPEPCAAADADIDGGRQHADTEEHPSREPLGPLPFEVHPAIVAESSGPLAEAGRIEPCEDHPMEIICTTIDCADPARVAAFWNAALGWGGVAVDASGAGALCGPPQGGTYLEFVRVPEG